MKTAVVILNWNGRQMLERYLPSVVANNSSQSEIIVADNGSTDNSVSFLQQNYPQLRIIKLDKNYGFAEGYNRALKEVEADYYVLLNSDVEVTPHWIEPIAEYLDAHPDTAIAQPRLLMHTQPDTFEYAGAAGGFIDYLGYPFCRGRLFNTLEKERGQYNDQTYIFWASGAAMFVRQSAWRELGGFDGSFFAHMEEIDLCWRANNRNMKVVYCPSSTVYHLGGGTLPTASPMKTYLNFRNNLLMLYKNLPANKRRKTLFIRMLLDGLAAIKTLFEGNARGFAAIYKAHRDFKKQRKSMPKNSGVTYPANIFRRSIVVEYFIRKHRHFSDLQPSDFTTFSKP